MIILLIGDSIGMGSILASALMAMEARDRVHIVTAPTEEVQTAREHLEAVCYKPTWNIDECYAFCPERRDRHYDREQAKFHDVRFPKWSKRRVRSKCNQKNTRRR